MKRTRRLTVAVLVLSLVLASMLMIVAACGQRTLTFALGEHAASDATVPDAVKLAEGETTTLPQAPKAAEGWEFAGWGESKLQAGATYTMPASDTTLTAQWTEKQTTPPTPPATKHTLSFALGDHAASGATAPASVELKEGATTTLPQAPAAEEGWEFAGWGESKLQAGATYTMPASDTTLTAQWTEKTTPPTPTGTYTLTIGQIGDGATIDLSPKAEETATGVYTYSEGTEITVTVTLESGWVIDYLYVNDVEAETVNNKYTFTLTEDTVIEVITDHPLSQEMLESLRGSVRFEGDLTEYYLEYDESVYYTLGVVYDGTNNLIWQWEILNGEYFNNMVLKADEQGNIIVPNRNTDGTIEWTYPIDSYEEDLIIPFADYTNPFETIDPSSFMYMGDNTWQLSDLDLATEIASVISGYSYDEAGIVEFTLVAEGNRIVGIKYTSGEIESNYDIYTHSAELTVYRDGTTVPADRYTAYPEQPELEAALQAARSADSYTATYTDESGDDVWEETLYRTAHSIYFEGDIEGEPYQGAYVERPDGSVWELNYSDGEWSWASQIAVSPSMNTIVALFDLSGMSSSFFVKTERGTYTLREYDNAVAGYAAVSFAMSEHLQEGQSATNIEITLENGAISKVEFDYYVEDWMYGIEGHMVIEFENIGSTVIPSAIKLPENMINGAFAKEYFGTWLHDESGSRIDITIDEITIDGKTADKISANGSSYTVTVGKESYTLSLVDGKLHVTSGGVEKDYRLRTVAWEDLIGSYTGVEEMSYGWEIELTVTAEGLTLTLDGETDTLDPEYFDFIEDEGRAVIRFVAGEDEYGGYVYGFIVCLIKGQVVDFYGMDEWGYSTYFGAYLYSEDYTPDFSDYFGKYTLEDGSDTINIGADGITMVLDGETIKATSDVINYYPVEYSVRIFEFTVDGRSYTLQQYGSTYDKLSLFIDEETSSRSIFVSDDYTHTSWDMYNGSYYGSNEEETHEYELEITDDEIVFTIDGEDQSITDLDFDKYLMSGEYGATQWLYQFNFMIGDVRWGIQQYEEGDDCLIMFLYYESVDETGESSITDVCVLYRSQFEVSDDYSDYYGFYTGDGYTVIISESGISITGNGASGDATEVIFASDFDYPSETTYYQFHFTWNETYCVLQVVDGGNGLFFVVNADAEEPVQYFLISSRYTLPDLSKESDFSTYVGYYETDDTKNTLEITEDGEILVTFSGKSTEEAQLVYFGREGGLIVNLNGKEYLLYLMTDSDYRKVVVFAGEEEDDVFLFVQADPISDKSLSEYEGIWTGQDYTGFDVVLTVSGNTITLEMLGETYVITDAVVRNNGGTDIICFQAGGVFYHIYDYLMYGYLSMSDYGYNMLASLRKQECKWESLIGNWEKEQDGVLYQIEITATDVRVTIDGVPATVTDVAWDESEEAITCTVNGEYRGMGDFYGSLYYYDPDDISGFNVSLGRVEEGGGEEEGDNAYIGTYEGTDKDGKAYRIEIISDTEVKVYIDEVEQSVTVDEFDVYDGYTLTIGDSSYFIMDSSYDDPISEIMFAAEDYSTMFSLDRVTE